MGDTGAATLSDFLKINTTIAVLNLSRLHTKETIHSNENAVRSNLHLINRQQDWRRGGKITLQSIKDKHNTYKTEP